MPVPVLVLHDHQRPGSQIALSRTPDDVEALVRDNWEQGICKYFITDDNFARNKEWEAILDRLIKLREVDRIPLGLMIQVDTLCHKMPNFIEKSKRAGVTRVFIGLENINPDNLAAAKKRQNKITEYRKMLLAWKAQGILTLAGYILGFPADTPASIRRDIEIIQRELPLDIMEFFCLTPLPGSEDHQKLWRKGVAWIPISTTTISRRLHRPSEHDAQGVGTRSIRRRGVSIIPRRTCGRCCGGRPRPAARWPAWSRCS